MFARGKGHRGSFERSQKSRSELEDGSIGESFRHSCGSDLNIPGGTTYLYGSAEHGFPIAAIHFRLPLRQIALKMTPYSAQCCSDAVQLSTRSIKNDPTISPCESRITI